MSQSLRARSVLRPLSILALALPSAAQTTLLGSATSSGGFPNGDSHASLLSADGRFVAFTSGADDVVPGDTNGWDDGFVRDRLTGTVERVTLGPGGTELPLGGYLLAISADGRFVVFSAPVSPLAGSSVFDQTYLWDRASSSVELISVSPTGAPGDQWSTGPAAITPDGRFVAFSSNAGNLAPGDIPGELDVFLRDRANGTTVLISAALNGARPNAQSGGSPVAISDDGRFVAFDSQASNLVPGDTNGTGDVFLRDVVNGTTERVSLTSTGGQAMPSVPGQVTYAASLSGDARYVVFASSLPGFVPEDVDVLSDIFLRDRSAGTTRRISVSSTGSQLAGFKGPPRISANGRWVAFTNDANIEVRDVQTGTTEQVNLSSTGATVPAYINGMTPPPISADGRFVAFDSSDPSVVPGDTGAHVDVFLRDRGAQEPFASYCFGDGTGAACPCGNVSAFGNQEGCAHSFGYGGRLRADGIADATADSFVLLAEHMPDSFALFFQGTQQVLGGAGAPFGDGLRCAGGTNLRLGTKENVGGASQYPAAGDAPISIAAGLTSGDVRTYQVWFRNAATFCTSDTFNTTNGIEVVW